MNRGFERVNRDPQKISWIWGFLAILCVIAGLGLSTAYLYISVQKPQYQQKQEFIQKNTVKILTKMLGKNNFIVNVSIQYAEFQKQVSSVEYTPHDVTEKYQQTEQNEQKNEANDDKTVEGASKKNVEDNGQNTNKYFTSERYQPPAATNEPAKGQDEAAALKDRKDVVERLPGLAPRNSNGNKDDLPGFPKVAAVGIDNRNTQKTATQAQPGQLRPGDEVVSMPKHDTAEKQGNTAEDLKNQLTDKHKTESTQGLDHKEDQTVVKQVLNENKETMIIPDSKIEKLYIGLILNQDKLKELNITKEQVAAVVQSVCGYRDDRGDQFYLMAYPFKGLAYTIKKSLSDTIDLFVYYRIFFMIVIGVPLLCVALIWLVRWYVRYRAEQLRQQAMEQAREESRKQIETQSKADKQQEEIVALAKSKPEDLAKVISDWIEKGDSI